MVFKRSLICGVGVNDSDEATCKTVNGKVVSCHYYKTWSGMLFRCYAKDLKNKRRTYAEASVCDEWHLFSNFKRWMEKQDWQGKQLDKDLLINGNKVYSPSTCIFVTCSINNFIIDAGASRGDYPIGVYYEKLIGKFRAQCNNPFKKKVEKIGCFNNPQDAHLAWRKRKHEYACQLADLQTDERVANALRNRYL